LVQDIAWFVHQVPAHHKGRGPIQPRLVERVIMRGPRGGKRPMVRFALAEDIQGFSRKEMAEAIADQRVLGLSSYREFGDSYIELTVVSSLARLDYFPYLFLFDPPCQLRETELPDYRDSTLWNSYLDFFNDHSHYFARQL
jgi:hypothetical protein